MFLAGTNEILPLPLSMPEVTKPRLDPDLDRPGLFIKGTLSIINSL